MKTISGARFAQLYENPLLLLPHQIVPCINLGQYCNASAKCADWISLLPAKSTIVRVSLRLALSLSKGCNDRLVPTDLSDLSPSHPKNCNQLTMIPSYNRIKVQKKLYAVNSAVDRVRNIPRRSPKRIINLLSVLLLRE